MSKKRPAESSWDSDEELLNDTSGSAVTAFPKASELDLLGDDGELDEDALLGVDEAGTKTTISFNNDSLWPLTTRQRSKTSISHQEQDAASSEQAFVFEETDTADLEDELNVGVQEEDGSGYNVGGDDYGAGLYHQGGDSSSADVISSSGDRHVNFTVHGIDTSDSREIGFMADQTTYSEENGAEFGDVSASGDYIEAGHESHEDTSGVELEYEQPVEHEEQVHLEYDDSHNIGHDDHMESEEPKQNYESESDSDNENSRHNRGKFTSERTGVISLTPANTREAIPDTLEINEEQAAQIEQFISDKTQKSKGKGKNQGRGNAHSRLGNQQNNRTQQNPKMPNRPPQNPKMPQGSRMGQFPRGMPNQNAQMPFPFPGGPSNRGPFPGGLLNPRSPFPLRLLNQQGPFPGPQNNREPFPLRSGNQRASFGGGPMNMLMGGPQRGPFQHPQQDRFPGPPSQRGPYPGNSQPQNLLNHQQRPQQMRGPPPNQLRPQGSFNQRMPNQAQLRQQPPQLRQQGGRMPGPGMAGPRPFLGQPEAGMRFVRPGRPSATNQQGQHIPSLLRPGMIQEKSPQGNQQVRPAQMNPLMPQDARRVSPHNRLGPMQGPNRFQNPVGQPQRPRFMARTPPSGAPQMNFPVFQDNHQQPHMGAQGDVQTHRTHKIYINPRFQGQQQHTGDPNQGRTVKMGAPIQQKAKMLLDRAIQIQNKQAQPGQAAQAGMKRKSTGEEAVPIKVIKSDVSTPGKTDVTSTRVVQTGNEPVKEDPQKIKTLLEEQKRQREMIQRRKELARQKQAALKRMELEKRLKEEGKTLDDIMGTSKDEGTVEQPQTQQTEPPVKQISGSVAARLGPPPSQQQIRGPAPQQQGQHARPVTKIRPPLPQNASAFQRSPQFPVPQQAQTMQIRAPGQTSAFPNRPPVQADPRMRGPPPGNNPRPRGPLPDNFRFTGPPPSTNKPRLPPPTLNQFQTPPPNFDTRYQAPPSSQDHSFRVPPPTASQRLRAPAPMTQPKLRAASHQTTMQSSTASSHAVRYTTPPPAPAQTVRFQVSLSTPPPSVPAQTHTSQQYPTHYTPASAPVSQPPSHYSQPPQGEQGMYTTPVPQYPPPSTTYQQSAYSHPADHQYDPNTHHPPPSASSSQTSYVQPAASQYHQDTQQQYQASGTSHYSTPAAQSQYQAPAAQSQYQAPAAQSQYQAPAAQSQYQAPAAQSQYQAPPAQTHYQVPPPQTRYQPPPAQPAAQPQYQATQYQATQYPASQYPASQYPAPPSQHYQNPVETYSISDPNYDQAAVDYYSEPQPIQTVTSQVTVTASPAGDQRTVQHHTPVGQRIQTIGQRAQPVSGTQIRSIIHNVVAQPGQATKDSSARLIQSQAPRTTVATDGQVTVLDGPQKILIQNVPVMATKETLIKICRHFGQVLGVNLMTEQHKAVVQFQKGEQAAKCVAKCNQRCLHKTRLTVKLLPG